MIFFNIVALLALGAIASPMPFAQEIEVLEPRQDAGSQNVTVDQCSFFSADGILPECWQVLEMNNHLNVCRTATIQRIWDCANRLSVLVVQPFGEMRSSEQGLCAMLFG